VQLTSIRRARVTLAYVVEEVPDRLVGDEQPQQLSISAPRQNPEQRRALGIIALARNRIERVFAQPPIGNRLRPGTPSVELARNRRQSPQQLTGGDSQQRPGLPGTERGRIGLS
jgi:hypothetical protein